MSTEDQVTEGTSLEAQRVAIAAEADRRGWNLHLIGDEGRSAKDLNPPGLTKVLERLDLGEADALLAVRLNRVSRSVVELAGLPARARRKGRRMELMSPNVDTEDPVGKFTAYVLAAAAEYERDLIGVRAHPRGHGSKAR